jgi:hypothetical protein
MNGLARLTHLVKWIAVSLVAVGAVLVAGLVLVAVVAQTGSTDTWNRWSSAGQAFGVLTAVFSGFALAALVITFGLQLQELKAQRIELCQQRELLGDARAALHRSAEADLRTLHTNLMKMAMDDNDLADVWPPIQPGLSARRNRQFLYANLIVQHLWLNVQIGQLSQTEMRNQLRHVFGSPLIRLYWAATQGNRAMLLVPGTPEFAFAQAADEIFLEEGGAPVKAWKPATAAPEEEAA